MESNPYQFVRSIMICVNTIIWTSYHSASLQSVN